LIKLIPFELTDEQKELRETARRFAEKELFPIAVEMDEKHHFPREIFTKMGEAGFAGMLLPTQYDGAGLNYVGFSLAFQELNKASVGLSTCLVPHTGLQLVVNEFGSEKQKRKIIPPLARGHRLGAFGLTEPDAGSDVSAMKSTAILDGDAYILNGSKCLITNAGQANDYLIVARTNPKEKGYKGLSAILASPNLNGFSVGKLENKMGSRASHTGSLIFENVAVPKENLIGDEGRGMGIAMALLGYARITAAVASVALAQAALKIAIDYAKERIQFGKPIFELQVIQFELADMTIEMEAAESMLYGVCNLVERGLAQSSQIAMLKVFASDMAMEVTTDAVQILGGYGYIMQIYDGTNEIQRTIIVKSL
jgi:alkylation response protein AidB-like acyl-CoA dehydrogenase